MKYHTKCLLPTLLAIFVFLMSCDDSEKNAPTSTTETFELIIGSRAPMKLTGSCLRVAENTYQVTGNSTSSDLTVTVRWYSNNPTGTFAWDADDISNEGIYIVMTENNFRKSYATYDIMDTEVNSHGSLKIEKFGEIDGFVEGSFVAENAYFTDTTPGTSTPTSTVKVTGTFKVKRDL